MADAVTSKTLFNGNKKLIMQFTNLSDGTGESSVIKVDKSNFTGPNGLEPSSIVIDRIEADVAGMEVLIQANHTATLTLARLGGVGRVNLHYAKVGGLQSSGSGGTGDIEFTTNGHSAGDSYNIILHMRKKD